MNIRVGAKKIEGLQDLSEAKAQVDQIVEQISLLMSDETKIDLNRQLATWFEQANILLAQMKNYQDFQTAFISSGLRTMKTKPRTVIHKTLMQIQYLMITAYNFIDSFRQFITKEEIRYLIGISAVKGQGAENYIANLSFEELKPTLQILEPISSRVKAGFKLQVMNATAIDQLITQKRAEAVLDDNSWKSAIFKIFTTHLQEHSEHENRLGYVFENALRALVENTDINPDSGITQEMLNAAHDAINKHWQEDKTPFYKGGDINRDYVRKILDTDSGKIISAQVKYLQKRGSWYGYGAQLASWSVLFNGLTLIAQVGKRGDLSAQQQADLLSVKVFNGKQRFSKKLLSQIENITVAELQELVKDIPTSS